MTTGLSNVTSLKWMERVSQRFPVETWRIDDLFIWPLVCYEMHWANQKFSSQAASTKSERRLEKLLDMVKSWTEVFWVSLRDWKNTLLFCRGDTLLYSDGVSFIELGGEFYERFCDPLAEELGKIGLKPVLLTPRNQLSAPRRSPSFFVQPLVDTTTLLANLGYKMKPPRYFTSLEGFEQAREFLAGEGLPTHYWSVENFCRVVYFLKAHTLPCKAFLRWTGARSAFVVCYYGLERMAMVLACHELGLPCVDLQHGAAGEADYWPYCVFSKCPPQGYSLVPSHFWCWTEDDAKAVNRWGKEAHVGVVAGNQLLRKWQVGELSEVREWNELAQKKARECGREVVLLTLHGFETRAHLEHLVELCRQQKEYQFWLRTHPSRPAQRQLLEELWEGRDLVNGEVGFPSEAPLYSLLRVARFHMTELSSTVYEAEAFGVPTVLVDGDEGEAYRGVVERGNACFVDGFSSMEEGFEFFRATTNHRTSKLDAIQVREQEGIGYFLSLAKSAPGQLGAGL